MVRKQYTKEFKLEAVKLAESIGVIRAAHDLGVSKSQVYRWREASNVDDDADPELEPRRADVSPGGP